MMAKATGTMMRSLLSTGSSAIIPTEAKNKVRNTERRGIMSARICGENGDSASSMPATKAPRIGERFAACDAAAAPRQTVNARTTGRSRLR